MGRKSSKLRDSARNKDCEVRLPGHCNFDPETTVLGHLPGGGMGAKRLDIHGAYCCSGCHSVLDGAKTALPHIEVRLYHLEGVMRTQEIMLREGLIKI